MAESGKSGNASVKVSRATLVWQLRCRGRSQQEIADELGINQSSVSKSLARREKDARAQLADKVEEQKLVATARLEIVIAEAFRGWENSLGEIGYQNTKRIGSGKATMEDGSIRDVDTATTETVTRSSDGVGNPAFLTTIITAQQAINKLWGLDDDKDAPVEDTHTVSWDDFTQEEIERRVVAVRKWNAHRRQKVIDAKATTVKNVH